MSFILQCLCFSRSPKATSVPSVQIFVVQQTMQNWKERFPLNHWVCDARDEKARRQRETERRCEAGIVERTSDVSMIFRGQIRVTLAACHRKKLPGIDRHVATRWNAGDNLCPWTEETRNAAWTTPRTSFQLTGHKKRAGGSFIWKLVDAAVCRYFQFSSTI